MKYARRIAIKTHRFPDVKRALIELLERWGAGLTADRTERRMAVRLSQERMKLVGDSDIEQGDEVSQLPTVGRITLLVTSAGAGDEQSAAAPDLHAVPDPEAVPGGDDDEDAECEAPFPGDGAVGAIDEDDFYADVWDSR
nr:hypothetical protein [Streptomyces sp. 846.5]